MQQVFTTSFGRRQSDYAQLAAQARHERPLPRAGRDKWVILKDLTAARAAFGISDRTLAVLSALVSFHPGRELAGERRPVVFPSNATLAARLHGMAESTLRRHLAALVSAGLVLRRDSPNGKRFARRADGMTEAFGFDLSPLLHRDAEIAAAAEAAREAEARLKALRQEVVVLLREASGLVALGQSRAPDAWDAAADKLALVRRALRRTLGHDDLAALAADLSEAIARASERLCPVAEEPAATPEPSGNDSRNERHIQESISDESISDPAAPPALPAVLAAFPEAQLFSPDPVRSWPQLIALAGQLRPMLRIDSATWQAALQAMTPAGATLALLLILEQAAAIREPGAYLRRLAQKAGAGSFCAYEMARARVRRELAS
ncbi:probable replication protein C [Oceanicola granulosus HTCC2516]|uniref:Probable replication protein C n=1 Tax=Oceanicola granulosus (strain ATCC BAA-861 / DSM 15982 / KCTC 12143 / HTCC2516) TaxID=314256 RepID=Q2CHF8_OCEGH|nr:plasmid replication protein RepC [Oceanicola granulosus]EAR52081.1 probable replication protein C [Oceanicola granulosus HTCC2516]